MASYFDDHNVRERGRQGTDERQVPYSHFSSLTAPASSSSQQDGAAAAGVPANVLAVVSLFDSFRLNIHSMSHQALLEQLMTDLLNSAKYRPILLLGSECADGSTTDEQILHRQSAVDDGAISACSICTEAYTATSDIRYLPCGHTFDKSCIVPWLELRNTCPMCRQKLPTDEPEEQLEEQLEESGHDASLAARPAVRHGNVGDDDGDDDDPFGMYS
ncbi:hypothetical protein RI367_006684 [Sorochytrium milnesiophthora]